MFSHCSPKTPPADHTHVHTHVPITGDSPDEADCAKQRNDHPGCMDTTDSEAPASKRMATNMVSPKSTGI